MEGREAKVKIEAMEEDKSISNQPKKEENASGSGIKSEVPQAWDEAKVPKKCKEEKDEDAGMSSQSEGEDEQVPTEVRRNIPSPPEPMDEGSRPGTSSIDESSDDEETVIYDSEEESSDPPSPNSDATEPNYLEFLLPKSRGNQQYGERMVAEGAHIVQALSGFQQQLQDKPADDARAQAPAELQVRLLSHQQYALAWMQWRERCSPAGGILADDMGLGKAITTIALILHSLEAGPPRDDTRRSPGGTLIVCRANQISQWKRQLESKGNITSIAVFNSIYQRQPTALLEHQVILTSYGIVSSDYMHNRHLFSVDWLRVILDEASTLRNANARKSTCVGELRGLKRWALTNAPLQNHLKDIFPILRFLHVQPFDDSKLFTKWINNADAAGLARLHCIMASVMLRRTKAELVDAGSMPDLLPITLRIIEVNLSMEERQVYNRVLYYSKIVCGHFLHERVEGGRQRELGGEYRRSESLLSQLPASERSFLERRGPIAPYNILTLILRLRQICCHSALMKDMLGKDDFEDFHEPAENQRNPPNQVNDVFRKENPVFSDTFKSSKMKEIVNIVQEVVKKGDRVVIVSDWVKYLTLISQQLENIPGATYEVYSGSAANDERARIIQRFEKPDGPMVLLVSIRAAAQGLDLKSANHVIIADVHWNPQQEANAQNLVYRMGQSKQVIVHKLICKETIEESIVALQRKKLMIAGVVLAGSALGARTLDNREMGELFNL